MNLSFNNWQHRDPTVLSGVSTACVVSFDDRGIVRAWSVDAETLFGYSRSTTEGMELASYVPFLLNNEAEGWCRRADGSMFRALVATLPNDPNSIVITDVTSRHMRDDALRRVRQRIDQIATSVAHIVFFSIDFLNDDVEVWGGFAEVIGWTRGTPPRRLSELLSLVHAEDRVGLEAAINTTIEKRGQFDTEFRFLGDLGERWLHVAGCFVDGTPPHIVGTGMNITQRRLMERQVLDVSEQLQRQIGQDLHDGLGQLLTGTAFLAKGLQRSVPAESQPQARRVVELINQAIGRVRSLARGLSPIHVEAQTLEAVLRHTVGESSELLGVECALDWQDGVDSARPATIAQLCLIAREAITNAVRHGQARRIAVRLSRDGDRSLLRIEDDGVGIGAVDKPLDGLGLRSMRYRARVIGGSLEIAPTTTGTTVRCWWTD